MEYDWGTDAKRLLEGRNSSGSCDGTSYDLVICADCVYASASVEPLLASLCQVCMIYFACTSGCKRCSCQTLGHEMNRFLCVQVDIYIHT